MVSGLEWGKELVHKAVHAETIRDLRDLLNDLVEIAENDRPEDVEGFMRDCGYEGPAWMPTFDARWNAPFPKGPTYRMVSHDHEATLCERGHGAKIRFVLVRRKDST